MGALTEVEIFSCMSENLRLAAQHADELAVKPAKGRAYRDLRSELKSVEGCCRQASVWRQDTRWLDLGMWFDEARLRALDWLRGVEVEVTRPDGTKMKHRVPMAMGQRHPLFLKLAERLRFYRGLAEQVRTMRTGRVGMILPDCLSRPAERRIGAPVSMSGLKMRDSGLVVPSTVQ